MPALRKADPAAERLGEGFARIAGSIELQQQIATCSMIEGVVRELARPRERVEPRQPGLRTIGMSRRDHARRRGEHVGA